MNSSSQNGVVIQRFLDESQRANAAHLFDEAFATKFKNAIPDDELRKEFWSTILVSSQVFSAFDKDVLVGIAVMSSAEKSGFNKRASKILFEVLGPIKWMRAVFYFLIFSRLDSKIKPGTLYLEAISVASNARGRGIGRIMLAELNNFCLDKNFDNLQLKVIFENESALKLYLREGFKVIKNQELKFLKYILGFSGVATMNLEIKFN